MSIAPTDKQRVDFCVCKAIQIKKYQIFQLIGKCFFFIRNTTIHFMVLPFPMRDSLQFFFVLSTQHFNEIKLKLKWRNNLKISFYAQTVSFIKFIFFPDILIRDAGEQQTKKKILMRLNKFDPKIKSLVQVSDPMSHGVIQTDRFKNILPKANAVFFSLKTVFEFYLFTFKSLKYIRVSVQTCRETQKRFLKNTLNPFDTFFFLFAKLNSNLFPFSPSRGCVYMWLECSNFPKVDRNLMGCSMVLIQYFVALKFNQFFSSLGRIDITMFIIIRSHYCQRKYFRFLQISLILTK